MKLGLVMMNPTATFAQTAVDTVFPDAFRQVHFPLAPVLL